MSKKSVLDSLRVSRPCSEDWGQMTGTDQARFCSHCAKNVNDISKMTRKQAVRLARSSNGGLCIRYKFDPVTKAPIFTERLHQTTRSSPVMATGVLAASIVMSSAAYSQGGTEPLELPTELAISQANPTPEPAGDRKKDTPKAEMAVKAGSIFGTIYDPNGAVIPNIKVTLIDAGENEADSTTSGPDGAFHFATVDEGIYTIRADGNYGFSPKARGGINVIKDRETNADFSLDVNEAVFLSGVVVSIVEYKGSLSSAAAAENIDDIRDLISQGEDVDQPEDDKTTPLFVAVDTGNIEIVETFLNFGAKVNARTKDKRTPLMNLDDDASRELVDLLIRHGAKVNLTASDGNTALILAARSVEPEVLQALIDAGADVNLTNNDGQSALMNAASSGSLENVRILLFAGAKVNIRNNDGESAWDLAYEDEIQELLVVHGAEVKDDAGSNQADEPDEN